MRRSASHPADKQALLTALTTEHFTLQGVRSHTVSESAARSTLYISAMTSHSTSSRITGSATVSASSIGVVGWRVGGNRAENRSQNRVVLEPSAEGTRVYLVAEVLTVGEADRLLLAIDGRTLLRRRFRAVLRRLDQITSPSSVTRTVRGLEQPAT